MSCDAIFLDGPMQGQIRAFDRDEPPLLCHVEHLKKDSHTPLDDAPLGFERVTYVRDENPFDDDLAWIYMLEVPVDPDRAE